MLILGILVGLMFGFVAGMIYEDLTDTIQIRNKRKE